MTDPQQIVATHGRHQIVIADGQARDAMDAARGRYAVTTLGGAVIQQDLTHDEAQALLRQLSAGGTTPACPGGDAPPAPLRASRPRR